MRGIKTIHQWERLGAATRLIVSRKSSLALALSANFFSPAVVGSSRRYAQSDYEVTVIQAPECQILGFPPTFGQGLNNLGHVVGEHWRCDNWVNGIPFLWTQESGLTTLAMPLGTFDSQALDLNDSGQITGEFDVEGDGFSVLGFLLDGDDFIVIPPPAGSNLTQPAAINNRGQIVGSTYNPPTNSSVVFLWEDGVMTILDPFRLPWSVARDINEVGQIVGAMYVGEDHGFLWHEGEVTDLGVVPGGFTSIATAVNNVGQVVGWGFVPHPELPIGAPQAFLWEDGEMLSLGTLPDPDIDVCWAFDINDAGQIVGYCSKSENLNNRTAFIWQDGVMTALNDLIIPGSEATISEPWAINESGQIAGVGAYQLDIVGILLTPQQLGDLDGDGDVDINDFLMLIAAWGPCADCKNCAADLDGDCVVGIDDFLILLAAWT